MHRIRFFRTFCKQADIRWLIYWTRIYVNKNFGAFQYRFLAGIKVTLQELRDFEFKHFSYVTKFCQRDYPTYR